MVWLKTLTAPPRGNIPDGIKELTLQTVNIPTRGSQQETRGGVNVGRSPLIGDLSIHLTECCRAVKKKADGSGWEGNTFYLFMSQRAHLLLTGGGFWRWVESCHLGLIMACSNSMSWTCQGCVHTWGLWRQMLHKADRGHGPLFNTTLTGEVC